jgi:hypothetical protein
MGLHDESAKKKIHVKQTEKQARKQIQSLLLQAFCFPQVMEKRSGL